MYFRTKRPTNFVVQSAKNVLKTLYFSYFKITLINKQFLGKIDGGPYKKQFQKCWSKSGAYRPPLHFEQQIFEKKIGGLFTFFENFMEIFFEIYL